MADLVMFETFRILQDYLSRLKPIQITILPNIDARDIDPKQDRESLSPKEKIEEDRDILWGKALTFSFLYAQLMTM